MSEVKLQKGLQADYVPATYTGENRSGMKVMGKNVLVMVDECSGVTAGGISLIDDAIEKHTAGSTTGVIYAVAPEAFRLFDDGSRWTGDAPKPGDRIWFEKYAGFLQTGRDGKTYRIMDYRAVSAVMDDGEPETAEAAA